MFKYRFWRKNLSYKTLDRIDRAILAELQEDARVSNAELARRVALSPSACLRRVRELEAEGVIRRHVSLLEPAAVGLPVSIFVQVTLERQAETALEEFESEVLGLPEVMECYLMTGDADYLLRVVVPDLPSYERLLMGHLTRVKGIASIKSSVSLKQVKYRTALPLNQTTGESA